MATADERLATIDEAVRDGVDKGLLHLEPEDEMFSGRLVTLQGRPQVFFGSCSYLGLELDPRLRAGAIEAIHRYGTQFSTSRAFRSTSPTDRGERACRSPRPSRPSRRAASP